MPLQYSFPLIFIIIFKMNISDSMLDNKRANSISFLENCSCWLLCDIAKSSGNPNSSPTISFVVRSLISSPYINVTSF